MRRPTGRAGRRGGWPRVRGRRGRLAVGRCIEAPDDLRFGIFYGVSDNKWRFWDISESRDAIGYNPRDNAELWRPD